MRPAGRLVDITIHGGGWTGGTPRRQYPFATHYAKLGWVGISIEYRLHSAKTGVAVSDCVKDARSACSSPQK
jgi:acetyl esterase/lipase